MQPVIVAVVGFAVPVTGRCVVLTALRHIVEPKLFSNFHHLLNTFSAKPILLSILTSVPSSNTATPINLPKT